MLRDETVKPMEKPEQAQMEKATENQFFHLTFSQYINLNQRPQPQLPDILKVILNNTTTSVLKFAASRLKMRTMLI